MGEAGSLIHDTHQGATVIADLGDLRGSLVLPATTPPEADPYRSQLADFARSLAQESVPRGSGNDGVAAVVVAQAALESIGSGQPVVIHAR